MGFWRGKLVCASPEVLECPAPDSPKIMFLLLDSTTSSGACKEMAKCKCWFQRSLLTPGRRVYSAAVTSAVAGASLPTDRIPGDGNRTYLHVWQGPQIILCIKCLKTAGLGGGDSPQPGAGDLLHTDS